MKNLLIFILTSIYALHQSPLLAQNHHLTPIIKPTNCDPQAALLSHALMDGHKEYMLKDKFGLINYEGNLVVPALIKISEKFDDSNFEKFQVRVNTVAGTIYSVHIPANQYQNFIKIPEIEYIELTKKVYPRLDKALIASKVNLVHQGQNLSQSYSGKDVVVGIIDFGFDYTHPTFYNAETGEYRIKRAWEQNYLGGSPPQGYSYGHELIGEQMIKNEQTDIPLTGHGTHVASIAAGSGGTLSNLYRGVAFDSDIVLVSLNAREGVSGNNTGVIDGINYIFEYAASIGKPAVVNLSQGHHTGPHDGTSLADQAIDEMSGADKIIVGAVGNEGDASGFYLHFDHDFTNENQVLSYLVWPDDISSGITLVDIWGEAGTDFEVGIQVFNPHTKTKEGTGETFTSLSPVSFLSGMLIDLEGDTIYYEGGIEINPLNNRPHAQLYIDNTAQKRGNDVNLTDLLDNDFIQIKFMGNMGTVHAYAANNSGEAFFTDLSGIGADASINGIRVKGGNEKSTMGELGGTGKSIISVGGYTTKNEFINTNGQLVSIDNVVGDQYFRSSQGPTLDGRIKPDISAPANLIAAAENSFYSEFDALTEVDKVDKGNGNHWSYSIRRGTSSAAPLVAGILALMLEVNPDLTPEEAKNFLTGYADQDNFTGMVPNNIWGYGKVNAFQSISKMENSTSIDHVYKHRNIRIYPNPSFGQISIESEIDGPGRMRLINAAGMVAYEEIIHFTDGLSLIHLPSHLNGLFIVQLLGSKTISSEKIIVLN